MDVEMRSPPPPYKLTLLELPVEILSQICQDLTQRDRSFLLQSSSRLADYNIPGIFFDTSLSDQAPGSALFKRQLFGQNGKPKMRAHVRRITLNSEEDIAEMWPQLPNLENIRLELPIVDLQCRAEYNVRHPRHIPPPGQNVNLAEMIKHPQLSTSRPRHTGLAPVTNWEFCIPPAKSNCGIMMRCPWKLLMRMLLEKPWVRSIKLDVLDEKQFSHCRLSTLAMVPPPVRGAATNLVYLELRIDIDLDDLSLVLGCPSALQTLVLGHHEQTSPPAGMQMALNQQSHSLRHLYILLYRDVYYKKQAFMNMIPPAPANVLENLSTLASSLNLTEFKHLETLEVDKSLLLVDEGSTWSWAKGLPLSLKTFVIHSRPTCAHTHDPDWMRNVTTSKIASAAAAMANERFDRSRPFAFLCTMEAASSCSCCSFSADGGLVEACEDRGLVHHKVVRCAARLPWQRSDDENDS